MNRNPDIVYIESTPFYQWLLRNNNNQRIQKPQLLNIIKLFFPTKQWRQYCLSREVFRHGLRYDIINFLENNKYYIWNQLINRGDQTIVCFPEPPLVLRVNTVPNPIFFPANIEKHPYTTSRIYTKKDIRDFMNHFDKPIIEDDYPYKDYDVQFEF